MSAMSSFDPNAYNVPEAGVVASLRDSSTSKSSSDESDLQAFELAFVRRQSVPLAKRTSVGVGETPESILTRTTVQITSVVARGDHCEYAVEVDTGLETHLVYKRFSEIRVFRKKLLCGNASPACHGVCTQLAQLAQVDFPRRRICLPSCRSTSMGGAGERMLPLEGFLQSLLRIFRLATRRNMRLCVSANCATVAMIRGFLEVDEPTGSYQGGGEGDATERDLLAALQELEEEKAQHVVSLSVPSEKQGAMSKRGNLFAISEDPIAAH